MLSAKQQKLRSQIQHCEFWEKALPSNVKEVRIMCDHLNFTVRMENSITSTALASFLAIVLRAKLGELNSQQLMFSDDAEAQVGNTPDS